MFIHPWDAALSEDEWRDWLAGVERFGMLAVNNVEPSQAPLVLPTHFTVLGDELVFHLARPNPVWVHLEAAAQVRLAVAGDYAYIPGYWRTDSALQVPTSYYASVQFVCHPQVVDDRQGKEEILLAQMADFQPEGGHKPIGDYARMLPGIRGVRLKILRVDAKFKYDDDDSVESREHVNAELLRRDHGLDAGAAAQQRRRIEAIGTWRP